ncbi:MAG: hypothetical protein DYG98_22010 [Haliscomenobacteraceae bacterium CHB4]|nr:hypothetical protein [Saprospiraceae bacterium]MCE7925736.1 hypothetical protein [Haliscomenobacteraceae bacterium CHB4]
MCRPGIYLFFCLLFHLSVQAQDGIAWADTFNERAYKFYNQSADSIIAYGRQALDSSEKYGYEKGRVVALVRLSRGYAEKGEHETSRSWCNKAIEAARKARQPRYEASARLQLALFGMAETKYSTALDQALQALSLFESADDEEGVATAYLRIGQVYNQTKQFDKAIESYEKGLKITGRTNDNKNAGYLYGELGTAYKNKVIHAGKGSLLKAVDCFKKAAAIQSGQGDSEVWVTYFNLSNLYAEGLGDMAKALEYNRKALDVVERTGHRDGLCRTLTRLAILLNAAGSPAEANEALQRAQPIAEKEKFADLLAAIYQERSLAFTALGRPDSAHYYFRAYGFALENRFRRSYDRDLTELQTKYETAEKDRQLLAITNDRNLKAFQLQKQRTELLQQSLLASRKDAAIDSLEQQQQIDSLELIRSEGVIREKQLETERQAALIKAKEEQAAALLNGIFGILGIALALVVGVWQYLRIRRIRREQQIKLQFARQMAELETRTLRAQMNPHFIFNALASIKKFVLTNDTDNAEAYLSKFARLIRLILENSRETLAPLRSEIDLLDNYIQLERLRSGERFEYVLNTNDAPDLDNLEIPSLVLQPFVENAIVHGLNNRTEPGGKLTLSFAQNGDTLHVCIEDNGVGRAKAESLKISDPNIRHRSFGLDITQKRLEAFAGRFGRKPTVVISDLKDGGGTRVDIDIPIDAD